MHLRQVAEVIRAHGDELAEVESRETGRILREIKFGHVPACVEMFHYFAGAADKLHGDTVEVGRASFNFTKREPLGDRRCGHSVELAHVAGVGQGRRRPGGR